MFLSCKHQKISCLEHMWALNNCDKSELCIFYFCHSFYFVLLWWCVFIVWCAFKFDVSSHKLRQLPINDVSSLLTRTKCKTSNSSSFFNFPEPISVRNDVISNVQIWNYNFVYETFDLIYDSNPSLILRLYHLI